MPITCLGIVKCSQNYIWKCKISKYIFLKETIQTSGGFVLRLVKKKKKITTNMLPFFLNLVNSSILRQIKCKIGLFK